MAMTAEYMNVNYPVPTYRFTLDIDGDGKTDATFSNVSGLDVNAPTIEYKDGVGGWYQMPGQAEQSNITLRKGLIPKDSPLFAWLFTVSENKVEKTDCTITLTNESGSEALITWTITDAFPVALAGQNLEGTDGEGSIEEVTLLAKRVSVKFH